MKRFAILAALTLSAFSLHAEEKKEEKPSSYIFVLEVLVNKVFNKETKQEEVVPITPLKMDDTVNSLKKRLKDNGTFDASITVKGNRIEIQIPKPISPDEAKHLKALFTTSAILTLHKRDPRHNPVLAEKVFKGEEIVPGARAYEYPQTDPKTGKAIESSYVLVKRRAAISAKDIKHANPNYATGTEVQITLTDDGTKKMETFTKSLKQGEDHIVCIFDGKVMIDAVLNAEKLSKIFVISGLDSLEECEQFSRALRNSLPNKIDIIEFKSVTQ
ncbi:hypothetical protein SAMN02745181_2299 [Rubritalea squalenifaciens DSM 18772]|uniref:SecDF P1 head subdomain domain-containing protein n=2 Tax=Rubritalea squalenifaciens TaxID=407226 RepID=A0A1M6L5I3_9BACT|nr:hypothetical protein SAMN02745181_2299 [Rubritalea squalenifaciens DSM 18772]